VRRHTMPTQGDTACGCLTVTGEEAASAAICFCAASRLLRYATWLCPRALATAPVPTVLPAYACTEDTYMLSRFLTWVAISTSEQHIIARFSHQADRHGGGSTGRSHSSSCTYLAEHDVDQHIQQERVRGCGLPACELLPIPRCHQQLELLGPDRGSIEDGKKSSGASAWRLELLHAVGALPHYIRGHGRAGS
jgi:hypothetical protein